MSGSIADNNTSVEANKEKEGETQDKVAAAVHHSQPSTEAVLTVLLSGLVGYRNIISLSLQGCLNIYQIFDV